MLPPGFPVVKHVSRATHPFDSPPLIPESLTKAFLAVEGSRSAVSSRVREVVASLTEAVLRSLTRRLPDGGTVHIEDIQDQVELALMRSGEHDVARAYVLYRERRSAERAALVEVAAAPTLLVTIDGQRRPLDVAALLKVREAACSGLEEVSAHAILDLAVKNLYDGVAMADVRQALILSARTLIEREPGYNYATARLLLASLTEEVIGHAIAPETQAQVTPDYLPVFIRRGIAADLLDPRLATYDLERLADALKPERDHLFVSPPTVCAIPIVSQLRRLPPFPISSASRPASSPVIRTSM